MANRITIYGRKGDAATEKLRREMRTMSLNYNFFDVTKSPLELKRLQTQTDAGAHLPQVEVECANNPGSVFLTDPDLNTLRETLYAEGVLGITSYWI